MFAGPGVADADRACSGGGGRHRAGGGADKVWVIRPCCRSATPSGILAVLVAGRRWWCGRGYVVFSVQHRQFSVVVANRSSVFGRFGLSRFAGGGLAGFSSSGQFFLPADVGHPELPLLSVENLFVQDMLWAPVAPQNPVPDDCRETPVPRWRLAREGPFLAEWSTEYIHSLGLDVPSGILHIVTRTTRRHRGTTDFLCITRGSSNGLGSPNRPVS